jgi:hypothetical protein
LLQMVAAGAPATFAHDAVGAALELLGSSDAAELGG